MGYILAKHRYVVFKREIDYINFRQVNYEEEHFVHLYNDKIETHEKTFRIDEVFDLSYKMLSDRYGFFYLHTVKGVTTLQIKEPPDEFIEEFRKVEIK